MKEKQRLFLLILIMVVISLSITAIAITILYETSLDQQRHRLTELAQSQARLIEAVARFDQIHLQKYHPEDENFEAATISQVVDAHSQYKGFGDTGEFTLARRDGDQIVFLLNHRHFDMENPKPVPFDGRLAEPMRLALTGKSGTIIGPDYRGKTVLAAYEPVAILDLGIVAKIDLSEILAPFVRAGVIAVVLAILIVSGGAFLFIRITRPVMARLAENEERFRATFEQAAMGIAQVGTDGAWLRVNQKLCDILGYDRDELLSLTFQDITHPDDLETDLSYVQQMLAGQRESYTMEKRYLRKDQSVIWINLTVGMVKNPDMSPKYFVSMIEDISDKKKLQDDLIAEQHLTDTLIDSLPGVFYIFDQNGRFLRWNRNLETVTEYTHDELDNMTPMDLFDDDDREIIEDRIQTVFTDGFTIVEADYFTKSGKKIPHMFTGRHIEINNTPYLIGVGMDITDRKQFETALKASEEKFRLLIKRAPIPLCHVNQEGCLTLTNDRFTETFGYTTVDVPDLDTWWQTAYPDKAYRQWVLETWNTAVETAEKSNTDIPPLAYNITCKNRDVRIIEVGGITLADGFLATFIDVTDREKAEAALKRHAEELDVRNRIAQIFLTVQDEDMYAKVLNVILDAVDSRFGVFGYIDENGALVVPTHSRTVWDQCQVTDKDIVFPRETWGCSSWVRAIQEKQMNYTNERSNLTPEGHIPIERHVSIPIIQRDDVIGILQVANKDRDYTDDDIRLLKTIGNAIAPVLNARLMAYREERDRITAQEQLKRLNKDLTRSNEELEQFAYVASHDLQEPLRMVSSYVQLLERRYKDKLDDSARDFIHYAVDGANRMKTLINDLLAFSRVGSRGKPVETVAAADAVTTATRNLGQLIEETGAEISVNDLPVVTADPGQLVQLFQNLISNAIKYRGENPPKIQIAANETDSEWRFSVTDNGMGIDPQFHDKIFVIFHQLQSRKETTGTGIGLAICKRIAERHGGQIWVESEPGKGSTFYFTLRKTIPHE